LGNLVTNIKSLNSSSICMLALLEVDNIEQWSEVIMQLTTIILYLKIPVYDDILQIYRDFWTNFKLSKKKVSIQEYIFFSILKR
jgi:hypothetical protein